MLRQPSQSSTRLLADRRDLGVDERHQRHAARRPRSSSSSSSSGAKPATNRRRLSWTCGAASPTPWYSCIVSNMSSMSCWIARRADLRRLDRPRPGPEHRMAHARDLQNRHDGIIFVRDGTGRVPLLPVLRRPRSSSRRLKATEPERPVCTACGYVVYLDPKVAVGTIIRDRRTTQTRAGAPRDRARVRPVGVSRRLCRSWRRDHERRDSRSARGVRARRPDRLAWSTSTRTADGRRSSSSTPRRRSAASCAATTSASRRGCSSRTRFRGSSLAFRSTTEALRDYFDGISEPSG